MSGVGRCCDQYALAEWKCERHQRWRLRLCCCNGVCCCTLLLLYYAGYRTAAVPYRVLCTCLRDVWLCVLNFADKFWRGTRREGVQAEVEKCILYPERVAHTCTQSSRLVPIHTVTLLAGNSLECFGSWATTSYLSVKRRLHASTETTPVLPNEEN